MRRQFRSEADEQRALIEYCRWAAIPVFAIPNGAMLGGNRYAVANAMKAMGLSPGVPDLMIPLPREPYHGLFIEMKSRGGKPTVEQRKWIARLANQGYGVRVCYGFEEARQTIAEYVTGKLGAKLEGR